jgi:hypothetical protein
MSHDYALTEPRGSRRHPVDSGPSRRTRMPRNPYRLVIARNFRLDRQVILIFAPLFDGFSTFLPTFLATQKFLNPLRRGSALKIPGLGLGLGLSLGTVTIGCSNDMPMTQNTTFRPQDLAFTHFYG